MNALINTPLKMSCLKHILTEAFLLNLQRGTKSLLTKSHRYLPGYAVIALLLTIVSPRDTLAVDRYVDSVAGVNAGVCDVPLAPCQTIDFAIAASTAGDTIRLVSLAGGPITFFESGLTIPHDLAIVGEGMLQTEIDTQGLGRVFSINANLVVIDGVTLINGNAGFTNGGAIELLGGDLILSRSRLLDNQALAGGGIAANSGAGNVYVFASVIKDNLATANGGGVWCDDCDSVTIVLSRLVDNITGGLGGAIFAEGTSATARISSISRNNADAGGGIWANFAVVQVLDSEMADNEADTLDGGAVYIGGTLNIQRSTLAGNSAPAGSGGAVYMVGDGDFASANSTYSGNSALFGGGLGLAGNFGPGPDVLIGTSTFFNNESTFANTAEHIFGMWNTFGLYNSIVSSNLAAGFDSCTGALTAGNHNLIDDASCDTGAVDFNLGTVTNLDPGLAYNGGLTRTHNIDPASNAVDAGNNTAAKNPWTGAPLVMDQRALPRPVDYNGDGIDEVDIGAIELQP